MSENVERGLAETPFAALVDPPRRARVAEWFEALGRASPALADQLVEALRSGEGSGWWRALCASEFIRASVMAEPATAMSVLAGTWSPSSAPSVDVGDGSLDTVRARLRHHRRREMLAIAWRDLAARATLAETLSSLSSLADDCLIAAMQSARREMTRRYGVLRDADGGEVPLLTLCMGKLGGRELNFSSDIDVVFTFPCAGASDGRRSLDASEYCLREARIVIDLIHRRTADGRVFRVDTRLRPFGEAGPLAIGFGALEAYLQTHGRDWERYAFVKARFVAIDARGLQRAHEFEKDVIRPFVYRRYLDFGVLESLRDMKRMIEREVARRELSGHLKLGPGGIREIEFIAQVLQLIRGGQVASLRTRSLYAALTASVETGDLSAGQAERLRAAYDLLRTCENRLQALDDRQVHALPDDDDGRASLALAMGSRDWSALARTLEAHRDAVSNEFEALVFDAGGDTPTDDQADWLAMTRDELSSALDTLGVADASMCADTLVAFAGRLARTPVDALSQERLALFVDRVMQLLPAAGSPATCLQRLLDIAGAVLRRSAYLALLNERPAALEHLAELVAGSAYLARQVAAHPMLLDTLLDARAREEPVTRQTLEQALAELEAERAPDDSEAAVQALIRFAQAAWFRIAVADAEGALPLMKVSDRLTDVAELILQRVLEIAWRDLEERHGAPQGCSPAHPRFAIVAYGKLGGWELGYGSDLDIVFLHDLPDGETAGAKPLDNTMFVARLARRIVHLLSVQTGDGRLYEVDTRLRPSGRSGLLVSSLAAFERYQSKEAWTWEHQALTRARAVAGDADIGQRFASIRGAVLTQSVRHETLAEEVVWMRQRMHRELSSAKTGQFDLKQDRGGIADLEFIVQYLVLANAAETPALLTWSDNIRQLDSLAEAGLLSAALAGDLQQAYREFRAVVHRCSLNHVEPVVDDTELTMPRAVVERAWRSVFGDTTPSDDARDGEPG